MLRARHTCLLAMCLGTLSGFAQQGAPETPPLKETVVVVGSLGPVTQGESARTVTTFDTQQHRLAYQDLEDYLREDASVDIQQRAPAGVMADISVRGASFEQTLVLLNGLRMDNVETSHFNLDLPVPLGAIGNINVLHGAGSTLYGSDAVGGVADFVTWTPEADTLRLRAGGGSFGENEQAFLGALARKHWSEVLAGSRNFSNGFIADRDYRTEDASTETRVTSRLGATDLLFAGNDRAFGAGQFYGNYNSWERTKSWFAGLIQQFNSHTQAAFGYRRHSDIFLLERDEPQGYKNQHIDDGFEGSLRDRRDPFKNTSLLYGLEETADQIRSTNLGRHGRNRGAGYAVWEWRAHQRGSVSLGFREEVFSGGRSVFSPTAAGTLWLPRAVKLHAAVSHGFRLPTYLDLYYSDPSTLGNPNLKPESAWNFEAGADWYPSSRVAATLTGFYSKQTNTIDYTRVSPAEPWQATNLSGLSFAGVEAAVEWRANSSQQFKLAWTTLQGAQKALHGLQSEYVFNYPVNNARAQWTWRWKQQFLLQSRLGVVERYQRDPYPVWDESFVREAGRIHPYLQVTNLSNTGYEEIVGVRMPGRSFVGGIEFVLSGKN
jgi:outer membrane cobalamin receptor